ncbi:MAG: LD-carboxypeptidase [Nanoarchaeota archaeon]|nr:LD-carboxypeptidase [Nanoarchaeota archaeon]
MTITIGMFATSSPLSPKRKKSDFAYLRSKGFEIVEAKNLRKKTGHSAGSIMERVEEIHKLLKNKKVDILMAYWGGANTNQLLNYLDYSLFAKFNKPIIGFSDTTALLLSVNKFSGITTFLGPAGITFDKPSPFEYTFDYFKKILIEKEKDILIEDSKEFADDQYFLRKDSNHRIKNKNGGRKVFRGGSARGKIIAGNLQTLLVLSGTKFFPDLRGKILFIEEAEEENTQMIHRFFTQLSQIIDLNTLAGICIGRFSSQSGFSNTDSEEMIYEDVFKGIKIPILYNLDFGHTDPMFTIPIGGEAIIDTDKNILEIKIN